MKKIAISLIILLAVAFIGIKVAQPVLATVQDQCNQVFEYTKSQDFDDSRVHINFQDNGHTIDVSAQSGYQVTEVSLDVQDDGHGGYWLYATGPLNDFNPSPGGNIDSTKVKVKKVCPNPSPSSTPVATPVASPVASPTSQPDPTPEATPRATPEASPCTGIQENGHECGWSPPLYTPPEYKPAVCTVALPTPVTPKYEAISETSVKLTWDADDTNTTHWSISYGYDKDNLPYGTGNLPKEAREFTVNDLQPGTVKWFELARWNGDECAVYGQRIDP